MSDPILIFECWLKTSSAEVEISTYPEQLVVPLENLPSRAYHLDVLWYLYKVSAAKVLGLWLIWWKVLTLKKVRRTDIKIRWTYLSIETWHISGSFLIMEPQNILLLNRSSTIGLSKETDLLSWSVHRGPLRPLRGSFQLLWLHSKTDIVTLRCVWRCEVVCYFCPIFQKIFYRNALRKQRYQ